MGLFGKKEVEVNKASIKERCTAALGIFKTAYDELVAANEEADALITGHQTEIEFLTGEINDLDTIIGDNNKFLKKLSDFVK